MIVSFLFWNLMNRPLQERIARIVATHDIDVVVLAECGTVSLLDLKTALNQTAAATPRAFDLPTSLSEGIRIFTRFNPALLVDQFNDANGGSRFGICG
jgi:hypothetical protein